jgi:hypothetical protein
MRHEILDSFIAEDNRSRSSSKEQEIVPCPGRCKTATPPLSLFPAAISSSIRENDKAWWHVLYYSIGTIR